MVLKSQEEDLMKRLPKVDNCIESLSMELKEGLKILNQHLPLSERTSEEAEPRNWSTGV